MDNQEQKPEQLEVLWTVGMVAKYLSINPGTVYNWISTGKIKVVKLNESRVRIPKSEVERIAGVKKSNLLKE